MEESLREDLKEKEEKEKQNSHKSSFIEINGEMVEVDNKLIPLVRALNDLGIRTLSCCEKNGIGHTYIEFLIKGITR